MRLPCNLFLSTTGKRLQPVFTNGFQHQQVRFLTLLLGLLQQAFVDERGHAIQDMGCAVGEDAAHGFDRVQRVTAHEDGEALEETLLCHVQQIVAPRDGVAQRLLPGRDILPAAYVSILRPALFRKSVVVIFISVLLTHLYITHFSHCYTSLPCSSLEEVGTNTDSKKPG